MRRLVTTEAVIDELGGIKSIARLARVKYVTAHHWKRSDSFPARTYVLLTTLLAERHCRAPDSLWNILDRA
jgi:hypothetical protein